MDNNQQLTIWTYLDRVVTDPVAANTIDLSNWIGALDLEPAGEALVTWAGSYRDRAIELLDGWLLRSFLVAGELVEPEYDRTIFDELVLGRMEWDLGDLLETIEVEYPNERQAAPAIVSVSKDAALELADLQTALDVAHDESVSEWGAAISLRLDEWEQPQQSVGLLELQKSVEMPLVQVWLGLLLNGFTIEQRGDFYDAAQVWVIR